MTLVIATTFWKISLCFGLPDIFSFFHSFRLLTLQQCYRLLFPFHCFLSVLFSLWDDFWSFVACPGQFIVIISWLSPSASSFPSSPHCTPPSPPPTRLTGPRLLRLEVLTSALQTVHRCLHSATHLLSVRRDVWQRSEKCVKSQLALEKLLTIKNC